MAEKLTGVGMYRILYAQPTPETGERIAVAVLVQNGDTQIYFDRRFPRFKKVFGDLELDALEYYLDHLRAEISRAAEPERVLNSYAPQIVPSDPRKVMLPVDEKAARVLLQKLLQPTPRLTAVASEARTVDPVSKAIEVYLRIRAGVTEDVQTEIPPEQIFGHRVSGLRSVAAGVRRGSTWVLVDGVDLNELAPKAAIKRADEVGRNFWQINREAANQHGRLFRRIGLVLNGNSHLRHAAAEAHDYSLHRLEADADRTFDSSSMEAPELIRREVLSAGE
ncbi:MAG: hypothetical protein ABSG65_14060 [Bryobacteraceae bacterium]|jgi:hypothetical protein